MKREKKERERSRDMGDVLRVHYILVGTCVM